MLVRAGTVQENWRLQELWGHTHCDRGQALPQSGMGMVALGTPPGVPAAVTAGLALCDGPAISESTTMQSSS